MTELNGELRFPWSVAELPDGGFLVAEREGTLQHLAADGSVRAEILGVPAVYAKSQGGLFDVLLAQDFAASQTIYLSYAYGTPAANGTRIARAKLSGSALENLEVLFTVSPSRTPPYTMEAGWPGTPRAPCSSPRATALTIGKRPRTGQACSAKPFA